MEWRWKKEFIKINLIYIKDKLLIYLLFLFSCIIGLAYIVIYRINYRYIYRCIIDLYRYNKNSIKNKLYSDRGCYIELMKLEQYEKEKE